MSDNLTLGEICTFKLGINPSPDPHGVMPIVRVGDLRGLIKWERVTQASMPAAINDDLLLRDGDVLMARSGTGSVGNTAPVIDPPKPATFASYVIRLRPKPGWSGLYVHYWLRSTVGSEQLAARAIGAPIKNISTARLSTVSVPNKQYREQIAIADRAHAAYKQYIDAVARIDRVNALTEEIRPARLVPELHRLSDEAPLVPLGQLTSSENRFRRPLSSSQRADRPGQTPYWGASGVFDHVSGDTHSGRYLLVSEDGSNLRTRRGPIAFVVEGTIWANNHIHVLSVDQTRARPEYLAAAIELMDLEPSLTGSAQPKLNKGALQRLRIPLPELETQDKVIEAVARSASRIDAVISAARSTSVDLQLAWTGLLDGLYMQALGAESTPFALDTEAMQELEDKVSSFAISDAATQAYDRPQLPRVSSGEVRGWIAVEDEYRSRHIKGSVESGDAIDDFYDWLRAQVEAGKVSVGIIDGRAFLREL